MADARTSGVAIVILRYYTGDLDELFTKKKKKYVGSGTQKGQARKSLAGTASPTLPSHFSPALTCPIQGKVAKFELTLFFFPVFTRRRWWWARGGRGLERGPFVHQPQVSPPRSRGVVGVGVGVTGEGLARVGALQLPSVLEEGRNLVILEERRSKNCESCRGSQSYCRVNSSRGGTHLPSCLSPSKC